MKKIRIFAASAAMIALCACSEPSFKVKGEIEGAGAGTVILEKADHAGIWIPLDSARLSSGRFSISAPAPAAPEIYRLNYGGHYVYFPVDSVETVSIRSTAGSFDTEFTLSGTPDAESLSAFEKELIAFTPYFSNPDSLEAFKRHVYTSYLQDARGSVVSYYALTKTVGGTPLFDLTADARYFAAVATSFSQFRPDDPRTPLLERSAREARRLSNEAAGRKRVIEAGQLNLVEISLPDEKGETRTLSEYVGGVPTILMFTELTDPATPALNARLRQAFESGRCKIYQVGMDGDQIAWRKAAANLPWATVYAGNVDDLAAVAAAYQVSELPCYFIISASGELISRPADIDAALKAL